MAITIAVERGIAVFGQAEIPQKLAADVAAADPADTDRYVLDLLTARQGAEAAVVHAIYRAQLQFPEHTKQSHEAGARMGAGILECDVTFTSDGELVCRHDQCDLHTTTDILVTPLADK